MSDIIGYLSKIQVGENLYGLEDAIAREYIDSITTDIESLSTLKANILSPDFDGVPTAPLADGSTTTQIANVQYVSNAILNALAANDAMVFKGVLDGTHSLPSSAYQAGWTYKVAANGTYAGHVCEIGDMLIAVSDYVEGEASNADWAAIQVNIDGAVTGPASSGDSHVAIFDGTAGDLIKDSGFTLGQSVPADGVFTDTLYTASTTSIGSATAGEAKIAVNEITFDGGSVPTREQVSFSTISSWTAGENGSFGDSVVTNKVTSWSAGTQISKDDVSATTVSEWSAGSAMTSATTSVKEVSSFSQGTLPVLEVSGDTLVFTPGVLPSLSTNDKEIKEVATEGTAPSLTLTNVTASHVTSLGSLPSLSTEEQTVTQVSSLGTVPSLVAAETSVYSITGVGAIAELTATTTSIPNISVENVAVVNAISASTTGA